MIFDMGGLKSLKRQLVSTFGILLQTKEEYQRRPTPEDLSELLESQDMSATNDCDVNLLSQFSGFSPAEIDEARLAYTDLVEKKFEGGALVYALMSKAGINPEVVKIICSTLRSTEVVCFPVILCLIGVFDRGTPAEKLALLFSIFDYDGGGTLTRDEVLGVLFAVASDSHTDAEIDKMIDDIFHAVDTSGDGVIEFTEFIEAYPMIQEWLDTHEESDDDEEEVDLPDELAGSTRRSPLRAPLSPPRTPQGQPRSGLNAAGGDLEQQQNGDSNNGRPHHPTCGEDRASPGSSAAATSPRPHSPGSSPRRPHSPRTCAHKSPPPAPSLSVSEAPIEPRLSASADALSSSANTSATASPTLGPSLPSLCPMPLLITGAAEDSPPPLCPVPQSDPCPGSPRHSASASALSPRWSVRKPTFCREMEALAGGGGGGGVVSGGGGDLEKDDSALTTGMSSDSFLGFAPRGVGGGGGGGGDRGPPRLMELAPDNSSSGSSDSLCVTPPTCTLTRRRSSAVTDPFARAPSLVLSRVDGSGSVGAPSPASSRASQNSVSSSSLGSRASLRMGLRAVCKIKKKASQFRPGGCASPVGGEGGASLASLSSQVNLHRRASAASDVDIQGLLHRPSSMRSGASASGMMLNKGTLSARDLANIRRASREIRDEPRASMQSMSILTTQTSAGDAGPGSLSFVLAPCPIPLGGAALLNARTVYLSAPRTRGEGEEDSPRTREASPSPRAGVVLRGESQQVEAFGVYAEEEEVSAGEIAADGAQQRTSRQGRAEGEGLRVEDLPDVASPRRERLET